ncbi:MAG: thioredoxin domain-containing protein [Rhodospirillaceae bacterium]|nr:thioredoxin domain-containing protein [Rhodospirillaceae bacterium]
MTGPAHSAPQAEDRPDGVNRLARETSPYLLQHKDNPVDWYPWGPEAFAAARRDNKPILLSVGYAACHWCHVMAHESFEDPETAALMNALFVNIKVDREERPDLDTIYQHALALLGQQGGWPLTMFLTPDGEPFWGGTYFPPAERYGRPAFSQVLTAIAEIYRREPEKVAGNTVALREALGKALRPQRGAVALPPDLADRVAEALVHEVDMQHGGLAGAPKFPQVPIFELLWRSWAHTRRPELRDAVTLTLTRIAQGGIYDHLGGGFARYSTDARWLVPHFEKMLYDNAELIGLFTLVWQETHDPLYAARVRETAAWVLREMRAEPDAEGRRAFASSLDADSEGEEGRFYVWSEAEIDAVLGSESAFFKEIYDVTPQGNWEGATILNRLRGPALLDEPGERRLAEARAKLLAVRDRRVRPGFDDKVLADWNGLMIAALAEASQAFAEPTWLAAAAEAFAFVRETMARDGRLFHSWRRGVARHAATLDDYAQMIRAALALHEATGEATYLAAAQEWVAVLDRYYWDAAEGGYFMTADDADDVLLRPKSAVDAATPAGNGTMVGALARLFFLTGDEAFRARAEDILKAFSGSVAESVFGFATLLNGWEVLQRGVQVVIVGDRRRDDARALIDAVHATSQPNRVLSVVPPGAALPAGHPAVGKGQHEGRATAYICRGPVCSLPIAEPGALRAALALG